jgi:RNA polymerase sigma-70 factor (ECF subfamily)
MDRAERRPHVIAAEIVSAGRAALPEVVVDEPELARHLEALGGVDDLRHAADLYLACACALGHPQALAAFERTQLSRVPSYVARVDATPSFADEVTQLVRTRLLVAEPGRRPRIADYSARGALGGWVRVAALRVALDLRGERDRHAVDLAPELVHADPELLLLRARYRDAFAEAVRAAISGLTTRQRRLLRMHFVDGLGIDAVGQVYRVHRATAARWLRDARESLISDTFARLGAALGMSETELHSLVRVVRSEVEVSLGGFLAGPH